MGKIVESKDVSFEDRELAPDFLVKIVKTPHIVCPVNPDLVVQKRAYYMPNDRTRWWKVEMSYDESLSRIRKRGFERHLRPIEFFSIMMNGLEENLDPYGLDIFDDIYKHIGFEWVGMAFERKGDTLITYRDPLWEQDGKYQVFTNTESFTFPFPEKKGSWLKVADADPALVYYLYRRRFDDMPDYFKSNSSIGSPPEGEAFPVYCTDFHIGRRDYLVQDDMAGSRGCRMRKRRH